MARRDRSKDPGLPLNPFHFLFALSLRSINISSWRNLPFWYSMLYFMCMFVLCLHACVGTNVHKRWVSSFRQVVFLLFTPLLPKSEWRWNKIVDTEIDKRICSSFFPFVGIHIWISNGKRNYGCENDKKNITTHFYLWKYPRIKLRTQF